MIYNFCTLFDSNYLYKGLTMYNSLARYSSQEFVLWILCMDDLTYQLMDQMNLPQVRLVRLREFESPELLAVKPKRSVAEYSWTCASNFSWYLFEKYPDISEIIYLDADIYFFNDPKLLIDELGSDSVMITEHRYSGKYNQSAVSGKYCVQFMVFKNNEIGRQVLDWWRLACLDWCFGYLDNGRLGDQKYLDDWTTRFSGIHELEHLGGGVAPWNVQQYEFKIFDGQVWGTLKKAADYWPVVFYHFHKFVILSDTKYCPTRGYSLSKNVRRLIYQPYFKSLQESIDQVKKIQPDFSFGYSRVGLKDRLGRAILNSLSWILWNVKIVRPVHFVYKKIKNKIYAQKNKS